MPVPRRRLIQLCERHRKRPSALTTSSRQDQFLALTLANVNSQLGWLRVSTTNLSIYGTPDTNDLGTNAVQLVVEDQYDHASVTNDLTIRVLNSGSIIAQGPLQISGTNS